VPQLRPAGQAIRGTQVDGGAPHTLGVTAPQSCPAGHEPQGIDPPQPSLMDPQFAPVLAHVRGVTAHPPSVAPPSPADGIPHTLCTPAPPQV
jgi:hypothetical protein